MTGVKPFYHFYINRHNNRYLPLLENHDKVIMTQQYVFLTAQPHQCHVPFTVHESNFKLMLYESISSLPFLSFIIQILGFQHLSFCSQYLQAPSVFLSPFSYILRMHFNANGQTVYIKMSGFTVKHQMMKYGIQCQHYKLPEM